MKVVITDTFISSLKRLGQSENPLHWRFYVRKYYDLKWAFWARRKYRKVVNKMVPWDYMSILEMLKFQLEILSEYIEHKGYEIDEDRLPKVKNMKRVIKLLEHKINDDYAERCGYTDTGVEFEETQTGIKIKEDTEISKHNSKVFKEAHEIEEKEWNEIFKLLKEMRSWWD